LELRHSGKLAPPTIDPLQHFTRWTSRTFVDMCRLYGFNVVDVQDPDDKVGNGFTVVIDVSPSLVADVKCWWLKQGAKLRKKAFDHLYPQTPPTG
jgi:hypothetical protein